jgi:hypothetical protein
MPWARGTAALCTWQLVWKAAAVDAVARTCPVGKASCTGDDGLLCGLHACADAQGCYVNGGASRTSERCEGRKMQNMQTSEVGAGRGCRRRWMLHVRLLLRASPARGALPVRAPRPGC